MKTNKVCPENFHSGMNDNKGQDHNHLLFMNAQRGNDLCKYNYGCKNTNDITIRE